MESIVSSRPHLSPGTETASDWRSATGREFEFMIMAAAIAKFLEEVFSDEMGKECRDRNNIPLWAVESENKRK